MGIRLGQGLRNIAQVIQNPGLEIVQPRVSAAGVSTLVYDTFTDSNGVLIRNHTPDINTPGNPWVEALGDLEILSNQLIGSNNNTRQHATIDAGVSDCIVTVDATPTTSSTATGRGNGIIVRKTDDSNFFYIGINSLSSLFYIVKREAGGLAALDSAAFTPGASHTIVVTISGTSIIATLDGGNQLSGVSSLNQAATKHGVLIGNVVGALDNFKIEA